MNLDMICACGAPGILEVEATRLRMMARLAIRDPSDLATAVALSLGLDFGADATIEMDQWWGVSVTGTRPEPWSLYVECDNPWDGLTAALDYAMARWPEHATMGPGSAADVWRAGEGSAWRAHAFMVARHASKAHYANHDPVDYKPGCDECREHMDAGVKAHRALDRMWGMHSMG